MSKTSGHQSQLHILDSASNVQEAFRALNAPNVSNSDFSRLYKGKLAEILKLVAHSVVGRNEANIARDTIQRNRNLSDHAKPLPDHNADPLYTDSKRAETRLKRARALIEHEQKIGNEQLQNMRKLEHDEHQLQKSFEDKRVTSLLLSILERKEKIRKERFSEIAKLLEELRRNAKATSESPVGASNQSEPLNCTIKPIRTDLTADVLSALQAHCIRVDRLAAQASGQHLPLRVEEAEQRLLQAVSRSKGISANDAEVSSTFQELRAIGRKQALRRVQYRSPIPEARGVENVGDITHRISEKEEELQRLADHSAALTLACVKALQVVSHFAKETTPSLRDSLQNESNNAQGHIDTLRLSVVNRPRLRVGRTPGESLSGGQTLPATISDLERTVKKAQATEAFMRDVEGLLSPDPSTTEGQASLIDTFNTQEAEVADWIARLLERKAKKAAVGQKLIADIERLVAETASIAGGHV
ncbi:hypothetical protein L226DRAFT_608103 [Lentinus tigrinus ALCF2SS1-7]|uniref:Uncharacterized protein n=1 Tax=Lentinus tigrinus ALCF2SS1-6 TaxID=1328759 RepID=A0A5C2SU38_9APHY|nr:hypothetical protein L227DRAFT_647984 [Lentinus tigrinus ALCF2SS1-6]RPD80756.1 hypothetical protein L226DRAFT_608103 [Lentinus tigrinus ALCF2SS1-7]